MVEGPEILVEPVIGAVEGVGRMPGSPPVREGPAILGEPAADGAEEGVGSSPGSPPEEEAPERPLEPLDRKPSVGEREGGSARHELGGSA